LRFVVDEQLPLALVAWLKQRGHEAWHVRELGLGSAEDRSVLDRALGLGAVVVTKDEDFARATPPAQVLWVRLGNTRNEALLASFEHVWDALEPSLSRGEGIVEITD
jgi:predicted nuclease of predicted toxin-antitoxin system